jgi:hypothetical protein
MSHRLHMKNDLTHVNKWVDPDQWYGATDGVTGELWPALTQRLSEAKRMAKELGGSVVIVETRLGADPDGEYVDPVTMRELTKPVGN